MAILLNIIGILIIVLSLFFINKISKQEKEIYDEIILIYNDIKDYSLAIDKTLDSFYELVQINLNRMEILSDNSKIGKHDESIVKRSKEGKEIDNIFMEENEESKNSSQILYDEIISLKEIGFNNEEIAKRLNKGVREVEIIMKMGSI